MQTKYPDTQYPIKLKINKSQRKKFKQQKIWNPIKSFYVILLKQRNEGIDHFKLLCILKSAMIMRQQEAETEERIPWIANSNFSFLIIPV